MLRLVEHIAKKWDDNRRKWALVGGKLLFLTDYLLFTTFYLLCCAEISIIFIEQIISQNGIFKALRPLVREAREERVSEGASGRRVSLKKRLVINPDAIPPLLLTPFTPSPFTLSLSCPFAFSCYTDGPLKNCDGTRTHANQ